MSEKLKATKNKKINSAKTASLDNNTTMILNWWIYSFDGESISIDTKQNLNKSDSSEMLEHSFTNFFENNCSSIINDINQNTKGKSVQDIKVLLLSKLGMNTEDLIDQHSHEINTDEELKLSEENQVSLNNDNEDLLQRKKYQKLTQSQIKFLSSKIKESKLCLSELSQLFNIARSTLLKIKKAPWDSDNQILKRKFSKINIKEQKKVVKHIEKYCEACEDPFWIKDVQNSLKENFSTDYPYQLIRDIMKKDMRLSFKRVSSRPMIFDYNKIKILRTIFWIDFSQDLNENTLVANCDECAITRNTKQNYTWTKAGFNKEWNNISFKWSLSLIMTIFSNGWWFAQISNSSTNSQIFAYYLKKMSIWLKQNDLFKNKETILTLDNWSYHKSSKVINLMKGLNWKIYFLSVYSPSLAPIELAFALLKKHLIKVWRGKSLNLKSKGTNQILLNEIKVLTKKRVLKLFKDFYSELKSNINSL